MKKKVASQLMLLYVIALLPGGIFVQLLLSVCKIQHVISNDATPLVIP